MATRPLIVGIGGTIRPGSSTERALKVALEAAKGAGAETKLLGGAFLARLPIFDPRPAGPSPEQAELAEAIRAADGVIVASPGYHGSISGVIKNALDTLELTRDEARPYFQGRPVGTIITADGWQAAGTTLMSLRAIIHALRGWPTPFGAALNAGGALFDEAGECREPKDAWQLATVAEQVVEFAQLRATKEPVG
ncbi:MAG TPA: NAD(P)H-dependent oxidoreductase [Phenylobacterium sp.]|uniref:NADPH-dependent FMN reductase n=1 Tax=Phenylobacterium sp. TaxID=1871053 RepID=UPI002CA02FD5|nr:NAD(P)H-dependent oxidoreductase [Phenylobacterium sp.]HSV03692.1 NAD(P)H-dependent oxidoreductase [Phenylobacterium sp.]